ncbi:MAG TPA: matrixin family metalloprotease, partial [Candidatus Acidoferrum sp.]|nr:matrixin family metalloprotease [Candidatus Acidoferrum sp.]
MTRRWRTIGGRVALVLGVLALPMVFAYNATGKRWEGGTTTMYTGIPGGSKWSTALQASMQQWTDKTAFKFVANPNYLNPCIGYSRSSTGADFPDGNGDQLNGTDFRNDLCGNDFGSSVLATTLVTSNSNQFGFTYITEADIVFNSAFIWDVYNGPRKNTVINGQSQSLTDFGRVSLHELGHVLGLDHENDATIPAIMAPKISDLYQLQSDDIAGANSLYAAATVCQFKTLKIDALVRDSLDSSDCRIKDLFGTGTDASYVDAYKFTLTT